MAYQKQTLSEINNRLQGNIEARLPGADAKIARSNLNVLATVIAGALKELHNYAEHTAQQINVITCDAKNLQIKANTFNVTRKPATYAEGIVSFTAADGSLIPAGTTVQRADKAEFITTEDATAVNGLLNVHLRAVESGLNGNTVATSNMSLISPIVGVNNQGKVDASGISGGENSESDELLRERLLERIQEPPQGGAEDDYKNWAKEVSGVTRAWVFPQNRGIGTVDVAFVMDGKEDTVMPTTQEIQAVQDHLNLKKPVTSDCLAFLLDSKALDLDIRLTPDTSESRAAVVESLKDYLARKAEPGAILRISQIREAISLALGEDYHELLSPSADIAHTSKEMPVLGDITWSA